MCKLGLKSTWGKLRMCKVGLESNWVKLEYAGLDYRVIELT